MIPKLPHGRNYYHRRDTISDMAFIYGLQPALAEALFQQGQLLMGKRGLTRAIGSYLSLIFGASFVDIGRAMWLC